MSIEEVKKYILIKYPNIDEIKLYYFSNYFYVCLKNNLISKNNLKFFLERLFDNLDKIIFYDENSFIYQELGSDIKGLYRDKIIYIRDNLSSLLKEITIYHELHHAVQTRTINEEIGICSSKSCTGRLIMEGQTQYVAELIYEEIHNVKFEERIIPSYNLRLLPGSKIVSKMHNYELYDAMLSKVCIILGCSKEDLVRINYLDNREESYEILKKLYNFRKNIYYYQVDFVSFLYILDYIYTVDIFLYKNSIDKFILLSGGKVSNVVISKLKTANLSMYQQLLFMYYFDDVFLNCFDASDDNYKEFLKYIFDEELRMSLSYKIRT